jgi:hypothetical protein
MTKPTRTIWKTVVVAGAMLGTPACHKAKPAPTTPPANTQPPEPTTQSKPDAPSTDPQTTQTPPASPDPCAGQEAPPARPRGGGDRPTGRGFVLA